MIVQHRLVSVITPAYNCEQYIADSIDSVVKQTYTNWELIVVDDCSTDRTSHIAKKYAEEDQRIRYIRLERNSGAAVARNTAIEAAKGEFLAFLDSDDLWHPQKLEKQIGYMLQNDISFTCTAYGLIDEAGCGNGKGVFPFRRSGYWKCLYYGNCIGNSTAIYRLGKAGKIYVPEIRKRNDFALWLRVLKEEKTVVGMQEVLAVYRMREGSLSTKKTDLFKYQWELYRNIEHLPLVHCVLALGCLLIRKMINPRVRRRPL